MSEQKDVLSAREAASFCGVSYETIIAEASRGSVPHRRMGRRILFSRTALLQWLNAVPEATKRAS